MAAAKMLVPWLLVGSKPLGYVKVREVSFDRQNLTDYLPAQATPV